MVVVASPYLSRPMRRIGQALVVVIAVEALYIDHAIASRIHVTPNHSDKSWVYNMELDGNPYRCVIRKSDGNFRLEKQNGADWRPIAAGTLF